MQESSSSRQWAGLILDCESAVDRLADRLRSLPQSRLARSEESLDGQSVASATYSFAAWCAAATAGIVGASAVAQVEAPVVPRLSDLAAGDQVLVVGRELFDALETARPDTQVWLAAARVRAQDVVDECARRVTELRASV